LTDSQAKTAIAPLDRVKILFQTSHAEFQKYAGKRAAEGVLKTGAELPRDVIGLAQSHGIDISSIRCPWAVPGALGDIVENIPVRRREVYGVWQDRIGALGFVYRQDMLIPQILIPTPDKRTPSRFFLAGATSGVTSVLITYPLELIRVRLAYQTRASERTSLVQAVRSIYAEHIPNVNAPKSSISRLTRSIPIYPFYRGFSITILGMIPYAGVSFLTYGTLKKYASQTVYFKDRKTRRDLACGAVAGLLSQTASYPFEVVRRRMQVSGVGGGTGVSWREAIKAVYSQRGWRGFFVGLSIGYVKVVPMTRWVRAALRYERHNWQAGSISFATWQVMKRVMEIWAQLRTGSGMVAYGMRFPWQTWSRICSIYTVLVMHCRVFTIEGYIPWERKILESTEQQIHFWIAWPFDLFISFTWPIYSSDTWQWYQCEPHIQRLDPHVYPIRFKVPATAPTMKDELAS
jgi:solute carrier family 25 protein 16